MTTNSNPRTHRSNGYASPGAVNQHGGRLPVYVCNACGREVVWCESKRTGRKYLANVTHGYHDQRFYMGNNVHPRDCGEILNAQADREYRNRQAADVLHVFVAAQRSGDIDMGTFLDALDALSEMAADK
jgi:predicted nucleic acid-binding protein